MMAMVIPVTPMFFWAPPYHDVRYKLMIIRKLRFRPELTKMTEYLLTSTFLLMKLELMSATTIRSSSSSPPWGSSDFGKLWNSTPSTVSLSQK